MKRYILVLLFIVGFHVSVNAQDSIPIIEFHNDMILINGGHGYAAKADRSRGYLYFSKEVFADSVLTILTGLDQEKEPKDPIKKIIFYYHAIHRDGNFNIVLSPSQIYCTVTHDNPNPNRIYWAHNIDSQQFNAVLEALQDDTLQGFKMFESSAFPTLRLWDSSFKSKIDYPYDIDQEKYDSLYPKYLIEEEEQTQYYLSLINHLIGDRSKPIAIPSYNKRSAIKSKVLSYGLNHYFDSMPQKLENNTKE